MSDLTAALTEMDSTISALQNGLVSVAGALLDTPAYAELRALTWEVQNAATAVRRAAIEPREG